MTIGRRDIMQLLDEAGQSHLADAGVESVLLRIAKRDQIADGIYVFELVSGTVEPLPGFTPGSHIRVHTPNGVLRKYSLCNAPEDADRYVITVKRDEHGRGGSMSLVDDTAVGQILQAQAPDNAFALVDDPGRLIFIAGGIGITPILSMIRSLGADPVVPWALYYLTHGEASTAYRALLSTPRYQPHVTFHHSDSGRGRFDLWPVLEKPNQGHVYCCGPRSLMTDVRDMSGHWSNSRIHFESFIEGGEKKPDDKPFTVTLARSGRTFEIPAGQSILAVLRTAGVAIPYSCESGTCGTCRTRLSQGVADHRDMVLMPEEKGDQIMVCVSRAKSDGLVLDL